MSLIDERIVSLGFNNKDFEARANESMSTLNKLDQVLDSFNGGALSGIGEALSAVSDKFSVFGTIGDQVIRNLTNKVMELTDKFIHLGKSMSIDQITAGWGKYAEKTASVQTIMNATGASIDEVNGYLEDLMWYSDETSFGFTDMTSALGQMTSTGGKVENLIPLLMGVGNAVAYAGKGASEFSRVVYNLNQSYGAGALQYMDWKSLELAGVASEQLKQIFIDTGIELGKIKEGEVTVANFSQTLKDKWADTSVMEAAFGKFAAMTTKAKELVDAGVYKNATEAYAALASEFDAVAVKAATSAQEAKSFSEAIEATQDAVSSGWLTTFELIFGNYEEAKVLWTGLTDVLWEVFAAGGEIRNSALERWREMGGYTKLMESLGRVANVVTTTVDDLRGSLLKIFGPKVNAGNENEEVVQLAKIFNNLTRSLDSGTKKLEQFSDNLHKFGVLQRFVLGLRQAFEALTAPFSILKQAVHETFDPLFTYNGHKMQWPRDLALMLSQLSHSFYDTMAAFNAWIRSDTTSKWLSNIARGILAVVDIVRMFGAALARNLVTLLPGIKNFGIEVLDFLSKIGAFFVGLRDYLKLTDSFNHKAGFINKFASTITLGLKAVGSVIEVIFSLIKTVWGFIQNNILKVTNVGTSVLDVFSKIFQGIIDFNNKLLEGSIFQGFVDILQKIFDVLVNIVNTVLEHNPFELISNWAKTAFDFISSGLKTLKEGFKNTFGTGENLGSKLFQIIGAIGGAFVGFKGIKGLLDITGIIKKLKDLLKNGPGEIGFIKEIKETIGDTLDSVKDALNSFALGTKVKALKDVAISIGILTAALVVLSLMDRNKLAESLFMIAAGLGVLIGALAILNTMTIKKGASTELLKVAGAALAFSIAVINIAIALTILGAAVKIFASMDMDKMLQGIAGISILLLELTLALAIISKVGSSGRMLAAGVGIALFAASLLILSAAVALLTYIPYDKLVNGLAILVGIIAAVVGGLLLLSMAGARALAAGVAIALLSAAILVLVVALAALSYIPYDKLKKAIKVLVITLLALVAALVLLSLAGPGTIVAAAALLILGAALLVASVGLIIIAKALKTLAPIKKDIPKIAGGLAILGAAMLALGIGGVAAGLGLVGFVAMVPLAIALRMMGGLNLMKIAGGLAVLGAAFIPLGLGGLALGVGALGLMLGGVALMVLSLGLNALSSGLKAVEDVSLKQFLVLGAGLLALGVAGVALGLGAIGLGLGAPALAEFGKVLPILAEGLKSFEDINWSTIGKAFLILAESIAALLVLQFATLADGSTQLANLGRALPPLAEGLHSLDDIPWETIGKAFVILAESVGALLVLEFATIHDGVPALVELGEALPTVSEGVSSMENVTWESMAKAAAALTEAIYALFAVQLITLIHDGVPTFKEFIDVLPSMSTAFKEFESLNGETIETTGMALSRVINAMFSLQFASFRDGSESLTNLVSILPDLAAGFHAFDGIDPEWFRNMSSAIADGMKKLSGNIFSDLFKGNSDFTSLRDFGNSLPILAEGFRSFGDMEPTRLEELALALSNGLKAILGRSILDLFTAPPDFTAVATGISLVAQAIQQIPDDAQARLEGIPTGMSAVLTITLTNVQEGLAPITTEFDTFYTNLETETTSTKDTIEQTVDELLKAVEGSISRTLTNIKNKVTNSLSGIKVAIMTGNTLILSEVLSFTVDVYSKIKDCCDDIETAVSNCMNNVEGSLSSASSNAYSYGYSIGSEMANGIWASVELVRQAAQALADAAAARASAQRAYNNAYNDGYDTGTGFSDGVNDTRNSIENAGINMADAVQNSVSKELKIHSPSRVMMELGRFVSLGLANGIQNGSSEVESSMIAVVNPLLAVLSMLMDEDMDISPRITPVVDLSNAQNASRNISDLFGGASYSMSAVGRIAANERASGSGFGNSYHGGNTTNATINVYAQPGQDVKSLAREIEHILIKTDKQKKLGSLA